MKYNIEPNLENVIQALDTYLWCLSVNENRKSSKKICDNKSALKELKEAYSKLECSQYEVIVPE